MHNFGCIWCGTEKEPQLDDGEQLARALRESLVIDSQPESWSRNDTGNGYGYGTGVEYGYGNDNLYQPITIPYFTSLRYMLSLEIMWHLWWSDLYKHVRIKKKNTLRDYEPIWTVDVYINMQFPENKCIIIICLIYF